VWWVDDGCFAVVDLHRFATDTEGVNGRASLSDAWRAQSVRGALRVFLALHGAGDPREITIRRGKDIKPAIVGDKSGLHFNLAHSGDRTLIAVATTAIGVDIEAVRPDFDWRPIANEFFHAREQARLAAMSEPEATAWFFRRWTLKEAYLKGVGRGSLDDMPAFYVDDDGSIGPTPRDWYSFPLAAPVGVAAALARRLVLREVRDFGAEAIAFAAALLAAEPQTAREAAVLT
jgi:4'-phosphopantetheinyl transferase